MGGRDLENDKYEKDVGVLVSNDLKPSLQCARVASKANQVLGQVFRGITYRDKITFLKLYCTRLTEAPSRVLSGSLVTLDIGGQEGAGEGAAEGHQDDHQLEGQVL